MSNRTLTYLEKHWPTFEFNSWRFNSVKCPGARSVANSRSGAGMVILQGIEVKVKGEWLKAHLSFPPDSTREGTFNEGHLKIESGPYLNQYFFSCENNETWDVEKLSNSPTVRTSRPGDWSVLGEDLWKDIDKLVTSLAYLEY